MGHAKERQQRERAFQSKILKAKMWKLILTRTPDHIRPTATRRGPDPNRPTMRGPDPISDPRGGVLALWPYNWPVRQGIFLKLRLTLSLVVVTLTYVPRSILYTLTVGCGMMGAVSDHCAVPSIHPSNPSFYLLAKCQHNDKTTDNAKC